MVKPFRLRALLELKQRMEEVRQQELAALLQQRRLAEEALLLSEQQLAQQHAALAARSKGGPLDMASVQHALAYIEGKHAAIAAQHAWAGELEASIVEQRSRLIDASREKRVLERLRDRQAASETLEADRREQRAADELVGQRFARQAWEV